MQTRRSFVAAGLAGLASTALARTQGMQLHLSCGALGVKTSQVQAIDYAAKYGFDCVDVDARYLATLSDSDLQRLLADMQAKKVGWATAGFPADFRKDDATFAKTFEPFLDYVRTLKRAGVERVTTWVMPMSAQYTYIQNFRMHASRLREAAKILQDNGMRFGLEYVGPKTLWGAQRFQFVHTMAEMKDLLAEIGTPNMGFVLDSWHWYMSGESKKDILSLTARQVVSVDLNDAPAGIPVDQQVDGKRELPASTGVIDVKSFLGALKEIGYDGPVRVEPFNDAVRHMAPDDAIAAAKAALDKAFAEIA
jgi:sugar phosphate isomerase/epimerase